MKELDFDELDKAVSSLMGNVKEKDLDVPSKTLDVSTTLAPDESPAYGKLGQAAEKIDGETTDVGEQTVSLNDKPAPVPAPVIALTSSPVSAPKSGRFMDVVHPSSDMRPKAPVSRVAATVAVPPPKASVAPLIATPETIPDFEAIEEPSGADTTAGNLPSASEPAIDLETDDTETAPAVAEPLSSPFLTDAKVEKRPLGGNVAATPDETHVTEPVIESEEELEPAIADESSKMDVQSSAVSSLKEVTEHVPEEFKDELLAVEQTPATELMTEPDTQSFGAASIPKQYQEKPSTGDNSSGAIYDTSSYHKPLSRPAHKKPVLLWIVVILVIIAIGVAVGAGVYFFGLV